MKANKLICLAAALIISCCAATGCQNSSSSDKDNSSSSSSSSSADSSSSSDTSNSESTADSSSDSSSEEERKPNAIGYDVKTSKRLYEGLKEKYASTGYDMSMKSTVDVSSQIRLCIKDGKVLSEKKTQDFDQTMIFKDGKTQQIFDHKEKTFTEQPVSDGKSLITKSDLLFGITGDFIEAKIDETNDVINEYYKINSDAVGRTGTIGFCFRGHNGKLAQITIEYDGSNVPVLFGVDTLRECEDKAFDLDTTDYKKA